jgi:hypothetical protein
VALAAQILNFRQRGLLRGVSFQMPPVRRQVVTELDVADPLVF